MIRIRFSAEASAELADALLYYLASDPGVGAEFLNAFTATADRLREYPESGGIYRSKYRRTFLKHFPYAIYYIIAPDEIQVLALLHTRRRPPLHFASVVD